MIKVNKTQNITIPKIIHQIAPKDKSIWHPNWVECQKSWLKHFPDFEYKLWNDKEDIDNIVYENYPLFKNLYDNFPVHIMKIDFVRLCILHKFGGIYADMDYFVYKNFFGKLEKNIGFVENLTLEYTDAQYENCLMYSIPNHQLLYELMKYSKSCFIHFRNNFIKTNNSWRNLKNDQIVNNTTGSGMISKGIEFFKKYFDIGSLNSMLFNNRPASYDENFYGKHIHTSLWGNEYCNGQPKHLLIDNSGSLFLIFNKDNLKPNNNNQVIKIEDFNFYQDYTNGLYLKEHNLQEIQCLKLYDTKDNSSNWTK